MLKTLISKSGKILNNLNIKVVISIDHFEPFLKKIHFTVICQLSIIMYNTLFITRRIFASTAAHRGAINTEHGVLSLLAE